MTTFFAAARDSIGIWSVDRLSEVHRMNFSSQCKDSVHSQTGLAQRDRPEVLLRPAGRDAKGVDIDTFAWHPQQQDQLICSCTDKVVRCVSLCVDNFCQPGL